MYESDEDRLDAAERAAEGNNPRAAAGAFSAIARDREAGDEVRLAAAEQLADVDPHAAAEAFTAIARDREVGDEARRTAAGHRTAFEPSA